MAWALDWVAQYYSDEFTNLFDWSAESHSIEFSSRRQAVGSIQSRAPA
jgi:hypothetical protein